MDFDVVAAIMTLRTKTDRRRSGGGVMPVAEQPPFVGCLPKGDHALAVSTCVLGTRPAVDSLSGLDTYMGDHDRRTCHIGRKPFDNPLS
jgi:hypothetical protein